MIRPFRLLGSLRVAVTLLITIAGVLAWGTIYETRFGTASVQRFVYQAWWFQAILGFLAVNLATAAFLRFPWKRKHLPFLLAHLGIIMILTGGILGGRLGVEGQLIIPEGESNDILQMDRNVLVIHQPNPGVHREFATRFETTAWDHAPHALFEVPLEQGSLQVVVDRYYPNAERSEGVSDQGDRENPAVRLVLSHEGREDDIWLFARDPDRFGARWGDAHVLFFEPDSRQELEQLLGKKKTGRQERGIVTVEFQELGIRREIPVPARMDRPMLIEGTPYRIRFKGYFHDFAIEGKGAVNRSDQPNNPAVAFTLTGPEGTDAHLLFALHPDFAEMHGRRPKIPSRVAYSRDTGEALPPDSIALIRSAGRLSALLTTADQKRTRIDPVEIGRSYAHPSLGYQFQVSEFYPNARLEESFVNRDNEIRSEALHLVARQGDKTAQAWLGLRESASLSIGQHPIVAEYRPAVRELPFSVKLLDFRKIDYPGTEMAAAFESDVELNDPQRGISFKKKISMNNPLKHRGYSLFQSSYVPGPVETTVLSVRKDPGVPLVYAGFLIVVAGVITLFTSKARMAAIFFLLAAAASPVRAETVVSPERVETARHLPVQHNGRVKPLDSFARETVDRLTGSPRWKGQDPLETLLSILSEPDRWQEEPLLSVPFGPLREKVGLGRKTTHISYSDLISTKKLMRLLPAIVEKQQRSEKLTMLENETMELYDRFVTFHGLISQELRLLPPPPGEQVWQVGRLEQALQAGPSSNTPARWRMEAEVFYNRAEPFRVARFLYLAAAVLLMVFYLGRRRIFLLAGGSFFALALMVHAAGIIARVVLGGRPPVSNFYETMLWLPFVSVVLALVFERIYRSGLFAFSAALLASILLLLADHLPLDSSISPVVAVLRSNLWLTIHVLMVVGSYAPITLAVVLAHLYGIFYLKGGKKHPSLPSLDLFLYRSIQVGVVMLASGIMLGAVWANASWGRYWGWDPKETWALITLLWFLALLHGRMVGWLKGPGMALGTIAGFFLLLMTYYGVSFYLVGLHSYAGGNAKPFPPLLISYFLAEIAFIGVVAWKAR
ncbi:MAG: cytochrome c biogenesis protein CcsA [Candidatus Omnitrophota bacterium]|nr:cytochrome c biogenesis protein CcsA [Candidatus Omnitrophota bacterium]